MKPTRRRLVIGLALAALLMAAGLAASQAWPYWRGLRAQQWLLASVVPVQDQADVDCARLRDGKPLVLLVLGQSNAGNHGSRPSAAPDSALNLVSPQGCRRVSDPLPGATGRGSSIWSRLPAALRSRGDDRPLVLGLLALDGLHAQPWADPRSPVHSQLFKLVAAMQQQGLPPRFIVWQQGEADARRGTPPADWQATLQTLATQLAATGLSAPILLARSTVCRSEPAAALHAAAAALERQDARFLPGANTDTLLAPRFRHDGCHFSTDGLAAAADLWADRLTLLEQRSSLPR